MVRIKLSKPDCTVDSSQIKKIWEYFRIWGAYIAPWWNRSTHKPPKSTMEMLEDLESIGAIKVYKQIVKDPNKRW